MAETVIEIDNLWKKYRLGVLGTRTLKDDFNRWWHRMRGKPDPYTKVDQLRKPEVTSNLRPLRFDSYLADDEMWALRGVSFEIRQGEILGIIGRNGAGKSTFLKILSRVTAPTTGEVRVKGRIASLLEIGTGFHHELSGRENIYLNGAILGMTRSEIQRKFDEIVAFADIEKFLDTPVKRYSSGMYVRLAFAVAAHLDPDILIVDEVLAVGDGAFQKKCLGKMNDVAKEGRTVLFVSHNMDTVARLCSKAIILEKGKIQASGNTDTVVSRYVRGDFGTSAKRKWQDPNTAPGDRVVRLLEVRVHDENNKESASFQVTQSIGITIEYEVLEEGHYFTHSCNLFNEQGTNIFNSHDVVSPTRNLPRSKGLYSATMWIPSNLLSEGAVIVGIALFRPEPFLSHVYEQDVVSFNIVDNIDGRSARGNYVGGFPGIVRPLLRWTASQL